MKDKECIPYAPTLIESMRSIGYSFKSAIADLIDNSISAQSSKIEIITPPEEKPYLIIIDDGIGMSKDEIFEAMRFGSKNPLDEREPKDLGRFGLGLKSASLSQCRNLVVISKKNNEINGYSWDLDYVIKTNQWLIKDISNEINNFRYSDHLLKIKHGTYIGLFNFDRIEKTTNNIKATFSNYISEMKEHIRLVFHRFIQEDNLQLIVNGDILEDIDPFLSSNTYAQHPKRIKLPMNGKFINIISHTLPHIKNIKQKDKEKLGGIDRIRNENGLYIYRNRRLIVWGNWFRLIVNKEINQLSRIQIDIPNSLDDIWSIDIKKSTINFPDKLKAELKEHIDKLIEPSQKIHITRGKKELSKDGIIHVWERQDTRDGCQYIINRDIIQLKILYSQLNSKQKALLNSTLEVIQNLPINALMTDANKCQSNEEQVEDQKTIDDFFSIYKILKENSLVNEILKQYPYCKVKDKIILEINKNASS